MSEIIIQYYAVYMITKIMLGIFIVYGMSLENLDNIRFLLAWSYIYICSIEFKSETGIKTAKFKLIIDLRH